MSLAVRVAALLTGGCLAAFAAAPGLADEHPRQRLLPAEEGDPVLGALTHPGRLNVFFHPDPSGCAPHEILVANALRRLQKDYTDIRVYTVLPRTFADRRTLHDAPLPGTVLTVGEEGFRAATRLAPHPLLEVWSGDGRLLLFKSVPRTASEEGTYDELLWTRSFTRPLDTAETPR